MVTCSYALNVPTVPLIVPSPMVPCGTSGTSVYCVENCCVYGNDVTTVCPCLTIVTHANVIDDVEVNTRVVKSVVCINSNVCVVVYNLGVPVDEVVVWSSVSVSVLVFVSVSVSVSTVVVGALASDVVVVVGVVVVGVDVVGVVVVGTTAVVGVVVGTTVVGVVGVTKAVVGVTMAAAGSAVVGVSIAAAGSTGVGGTIAAAGSTVVGGTTSSAGSAAVKLSEQNNSVNTTLKFIFSFKKSI